MTDDVKGLLGRAVAGEPPLRVDREAVFAEGRRRLRRRRTATVGGAALAVAAGVLGVGLLSGGGYGMPDTITPAGPGPSVSSEVAPAPVSGSPVPTSTVAGAPVSTAFPSTTVTASPVIAARWAETLRRANIRWPSGVKAVNGVEERNWAEFGAGAQMRARITTTSGERQLLVSVLPTRSGAPALTCKGVQSGKTLPGCEVVDYADGGGRRVTVEPGPESSSPTVVMVIDRRADGTTVEVMETSGTDRGSRLTQLLPTDELVRIATLPGLSFR